MANPNKTVAKARARMGGFPPRTRPVSEFTEWVCEQARKGARFDTMEEAREAFEASKSKT